MPVITLKAVLILRVSNERFYHAFSTLGSHNACATVIVDTQFLKSQGNCLSNWKNRVFKEFLKHGESVTKDLSCTS